VDGLLFALTLIAAVGCGLNGGVLFAFSTFVMPGLARVERPEEGMRAMQSINVTAVTPPFMSALFGTAAICAVLAVWGIVDLDEDYGPYLLIGGLLYLAGVIGVTMGYHVPRNNALAEADSESAEGRELWIRYLAEWTRMNHVRVVAGLGAAVLFAVALAGG
jgi:uncharacterized membrane protein